MSTQKHNAKFLHKSIEGKFTEEGQRQKAKKRDVQAEDISLKGSTSLGAKVNGSKCNKRQVLTSQ